LKILHTCYTYAPWTDGVAEIVRRLSEELAKRGHDVHVATGCVPGRPKQAVLNGVEIHRFDISGNLITGLKGEVQKYRNLVSTGNWDVVVNHCLQTWHTDAIVDDLTKYKWPTILVTQGLNLKAPRFRKYYESMGPKLRGYYKWIRVSSITEEASFASKFGLQVPEIITNGVDVQEFSRPALGVRQLWGIGSAPWLVNVSNHYGNHHKNHRMFFKFASNLGSSLRAECCLIGDPYPMGRWKLGALGISGGCFYECLLRSVASRTVELVRSVPRELVVSSIQEADVVISTSRWEANSVVLLESMAAGTPWISTDVGSARENAGGVVVSTLQEMVAAAARLLTDPVLRQRLGEEGRARAVAKHDWRKVAAQYEELYLGAARSYAAAGEFRQRSYANS